MEIPIGIEDRCHQGGTSSIGERRLQVVVHQDVPEHRFAEVLLNCAQVVACGEPIGLSPLGSDVADIHLEGVRRLQRLAYPRHQEIGEDAGEKASRAGHHQISMPDRFYRSRIGRNRTGL